MKEEPISCRHKNDFTVLPLENQGSSTEMELLASGAHLYTDDPLALETRGWQHARFVQVGHCERALVIHGKHYRVDLFRIIAKE